MPDTPASPTAARLATPRWLDPRLVLGVLLVLVSVVVGARVLASADRSYRVYVAARDVTAGTTLTAQDFREEQVRLDVDQVDRLVPVTDAGPPAGRTALRGLVRGDLVLRSAVVERERFDLRQFTLNVSTGHAPPDLRAGEQVDVYVTPDEDARPAAAPSADPRAGLVAGQARLVLSGVAVESAGSGGDGGLGGGGTDSVPVVLDLVPGDVLTMVRAAAEGQIDLVRVYGRPAPPLEAARATPTPAAAR